MRWLEIWLPLCACALGAVNGACDERAGPTAASARQRAATTTAPAATTTPATVRLGCELAKQCGAAATAAGRPWRTHGEAISSAAARGDDDACNRAVFTMLRAAAMEAMIGEPPAACATDMHGLFVAVGRPFDNCRLLRECGEQLAARGKEYEQEAQLAADVAKTAIDRGEFAGDVVCSESWDALLAKSTARASWPRACGGQAE